jgi:hypothetical protein
MQFANPATFRSLIVASVAEVIDHANGRNLHAQAGLPQTCWLAKNSSLKQKMRQSF